ncbi:MAG: hypothetical protein E4H15_01615 [Syntrophobacterales bacterium]|nr:MAG: hypothetical protein E4H15_01615 [Syntrophobacterales bacterium]
MDEKTKRGESGKALKEDNAASLMSGKDLKTQQPATLRPSDNKRDGGFEEKGSKNAGLSEEFFLSDFSGD